MARSILFAALLVSACGGGRDERSSSEPVVVPPCLVGGCSLQGCSDRPGLDTTCEWRPEYACYRSARCEPQPDGACGWTPTPALLACLEAPPAE